MVQSLTPGISSYIRVSDLLPYTNKCKWCKCSSFPIIVMRLKKRLSENRQKWSEKSYSYWNELLETPSSTESTSFSIPGGKSVFHNCFVDTIATEFKNVYLDEFMVIMNTLRDVVCACTVRAFGENKTIFAVMVVRTLTNLHKLISFDLILILSTIY